MTLAEALSLLGLPARPAPSAQQIKTAFRIAAKKHHPDAGGDAAEFRRLTEAKDLALATKAEEPPGSHPLYPFEVDLATAIIWFDGSFFEDE